MSKVSKGIMSFLQNYAQHCDFLLLGLKQMRANLRKVDCIIEIHDARISFFIAENVHFE